MINSSAAFQSAIAQDSRLFRARLLMAGTPIAGDIKTIKIHKGSCGSSEFSPGICFCPYIEAVIDNLTVAVEGVELQLQIGIMTGGDYSDPILDYITIGYFTAGKPETSVYRSTFTAQGRIAARMSGAFVPPDELTVASVAAKLQADTGVSIILAAGLDTSVPIAGTMNNLTCREALAVLAAVVGGYATETAEGEVKVDVFSNTVTASYAADNMLEPPVFADYDVLITGVEVIAVESSEDVEEVSYRSGDPVNVVISNSYMTEAAFEQFAANIIGLQYRPGSVPLSLGDPRLEPWDVLQITDAVGISFIVPCMNIVHTYDGGFATDIEAPTLPDETQVPSQIEKAIKIALSAENEAARARTAAEQAEADARTAARSASEAQSNARQASESASAAQNSAGKAESAAVNAKTSADNAASAASSAASSANSAATDAKAANKSAADALRGLSEVQDVVGVVEWAAQHSEQDMASFINSHLALTQYGLNILLDNTGYRIHIGTLTETGNDGVYVIDGDGHVVTVLSESIQFDSSRPQYIGGEDAYIVFYDSDDDGIADSIRIGGNRVTFGSNKKLSDILTSLDISTRQTATGAEITVGDKTVNISNGERGSMTIRVTTAPSSYTTKVGSFTPKYRIALSTVLTQSGVTEVQVGDIIERNYYHYPVGYVDDNYAYLGNYSSIRGATGAAGADAVVLRVDSSRGNVFKNNAVSTVLTVNIIKAGETISNATRMHEIFGNSSYIQWYWKRLGEDDFHTIVSTDPMISQDGFALTLTPDKVDTKVTFQCELIT